MVRRGLALVLLAAVTALATPGRAGEAVLRDDGIHTQPWMKSDTFLELAGDLAEAEAKGKGLVIVFEQIGCGACKRLHEVNFARPDLVATITANFDVLQINMYGDMEVTDFDGEVLSEGAYAQKMRINFSPTTVFFGADGKEVFRLPGYFKPFYYQRGFEYVMDRGPQRNILFPRWLRARRDQAKGDSGA